jgi:hypothetical protein
MHLSHDPATFIFRCEIQPIIMDAIDLDTETMPNLFKIMSFW